MAGGNGIWIFAQVKGSRPVDVSLELIGEGCRLASRLGGQVTALLMGDSVSAAAEELIAAGADTVLLVEDKELLYYRPEVFAPVVERLVREYRPSVFLFGATQVGKNLAAVTAARLAVGLTAHCTAFDLDGEGRLVQMVPAFGGRCVFLSSAKPQMATVAPGVFARPEPDPLRRGEVVREKFVMPGGRTTRILAFEPAPQNEVELENAEVVVAGGAGMGGPEGFALLKELAKLLKGVVGATRPPVDEGWATEEMMIGQSGRNVHPRLYLAVGISGDQLHLSGVRNPELFIAINKDLGANIFRHAHIGVVADYREIIPDLISKLQEKQGEIV